MLAIHNDVEVDNDEILDVFAQKPRQLKIVLYNLV